ncbi:putative integral membrane family protein [Anopheles sinensis]|uniref:Putative integral membrane family protein n=1 Tax=Anopheles sinensis TaxID=74873 RepID=A0A084VY81_ANOSI|nr:putative integral membrane family protein [Anopheles sinensis]
MMTMRAEYGMQGGKEEDDVLMMADGCRIDRIETRATAAAWRTEISVPYDERMRNEAYTF